MASGPELLTVAEMYRADALAMAGGIAGRTLMEAAGRAVAETVLARWTARPVLVLCGPGNNGGDGFVAARHLAARGWPVRLGLLGRHAALTGDAAAAAAAWAGPVEPASAALLDHQGLVVDALFGAGLSRPLDGAALALVQAVAASGLPVVAVDVPSGVEGDSGQVLGGVAPARVTVTFFRRKPGHLLLPGRVLAGEVVVADIGIPDAVLEEIRPQLAENGPALWGRRFPWPRAEGHKYQRGHAVILGGRRMIGAARLAAAAALRSGAGLVTLACPAQAFPIYAAGAPGVIVHPLAAPGDWADYLADPRRNAVLVGPGAGVGAATRRRVLAVRAAAKAAVFDADALSGFAGAAEALFDTLGADCLLTPHEGEFRRLFGVLPGSKTARARTAARTAGAAVLLKGYDTVVAAADGRAVINSNAPPDLATAGAGDVLAGIAVALLAQGLDGFTAGCMASWLHGAAAQDFGPGLIAEDLPGLMPGVLGRLKAAGWAGEAG